MGPTVRSPTTNIPPREGKAAGIDRWSVALAASLLATVTTLLTDPAAISPTVAVCWAVHVIDPPARSDDPGQDGAESTLLSVTLMPVTATEPVFVTRYEYGT